MKNFIISKYNVCPTVDPLKTISALTELCLISIAALNSFSFKIQTLKFQL